MVKRYYMWNTERDESPTGDYILASDFDRMRRRLVVKWLKNRRLFLRHKAERYEENGDRRKADICDNLAALYWKLEGALRRNEPLEYFNRLGQDKP